MHIPEVKFFNEAYSAAHGAREQQPQEARRCYVVREIEAAVAAYGAGKIGAGSGVGQIAPVPCTDPKLIRYAPSFSTSASGAEVAQTVEKTAKYPYTMQTLASFLELYSIVPVAQLSILKGARFNCLTARQLKRRTNVGAITPNQHGSARCVASIRDAYRDTQRGG